MNTLSLADENVIILTCNLELIMSNSSELSLHIYEDGVKTHTMRAESPMTFIAQGNALGIRYLPTMRPVRATLILHYFLQLPLQGALPLCIRLPRRCPGLWRSLGFQPALFLLLPNPLIESSSYKNKYDHILIATPIVGWTINHSI